jgi:hypothetical protein
MRTPYTSVKGRSDSLAAVSAWGKPYGQFDQHQESSSPHREHLIRWGGFALHPEVRCSPAALCCQRPLDSGVQARDRGSTTANATQAPLV